MAGSLVFVLFFASGFAALTYQVVWQRLLTLATGLDLPAVTIIVAVFLAGIGLGNLVGGGVADRLSPVRRFVAFAAAEVVIAGFALASPWLLGDVLQSGAAASLGSRGALLVGGSFLLLPTFCMGVTLPLLARTVSDRLLEVPGWVGGLYGWNTLGAAAGAWLGTAFLIRNVGYGTALVWAAALNGAAAVAALWLAQRIQPSPQVRADPELEQDRPASGGLRVPTLFGLYFLSGFIALSLELIWFRVLGVALKSTAFTFPLLLATYLAGLGAGSLLTRHAAASSREPLRVFLSLQAAIPLYAGLSVAVLVSFLGMADVSWASSLRGYLAAYEPIPFNFDFSALSPGQRALYLGLPALLVLVPTVMMGASFPYLQRAVHSSVATVGRRVGQLQAANVAGCVLGVALTGTVFLALLGTTGALRLLVLLAAPFLWLAARPRPGRSPAAVVLARVLALALPAGVALLVPGQVAFWSALHGTPAARIILAEDGTGLSVLTNERSDFKGPTTVFVNGLGQSFVPFGGGHTALGLVPALLHPLPVDVAVIGLGSGDTLYASAARPETRRIDSIEINGAQLTTLRELHARTGYGGLDRLLKDGRIHHITGDGRRHLLDATRRYDIIEADALRPTSAFAGNLYSREYFQLLRQRLKPGGLAVTWVPTARTLETFVAVFPHVARFDFVLVGSNEPIVVERGEILRRARMPAVEQHFLAADLNLAPYVATLLRDYRPVPRGTSKDTSGHNSDLFPRDELGLP